MSSITGAAVPADEAHRNRFPKTGAIVLDLRLLAPKGYALSLAAVPDPDLIALAAEPSPRAGHPTGRRNGIPKTPRDIRLAGADFPYDISPIQNQPSGPSSRVILPVLIAIPDGFITLSGSDGRGYFCPVLTADGKLDCAPQ